MEQFSINNLGADLLVRFKGASVQICAFNCDAK